jgi:hypothetical protein
MRQPPGVASKPQEEITMNVLHALWLPMLLSSVFVFVASSIIHMALPQWHKGDYLKIPNEDKVMDAMRPFALSPGDYVVPNCADYAEMGTQEFQDKLKKGPVMMVTIMPNGMMNMKKSLGLWFLYLAAVSSITGYAAYHAFPAGTHYTSIFRLTGVTSFLGYAAALWQMSIWYRRSLGTTLRITVDGLLYAALTAGTFGWLWPK